MKIITVIGARPQFIKAAAVSKIIRKENNEIIIHTGQHYDKNMSDIFFNELEIPSPNYNLNVGSRNHGEQTGRMIIGIEEILIKENPDLLLIYGDTNSTIAGAVAAVKLHIPIAHVEAGLRSFNMKMPEEINRVVADRISTFLFCPTQTAVQNLFNENIKSNVYNVGDVMCDAVLYFEKKLLESGYYFKRLKALFNSKIKEEKEYYLATIHRAENTDDINKIKEILKALNSLDKKVLFPVHPRLNGMIKELIQLDNYKNIMFVAPVGYMDMLFFTKNAKKIITDSGGLQKESYILKTPCVTVREQTEWTETLTNNYNILTKPNKMDIIKKVETNVVFDNCENYYGNGKAAEIICDVINKECSSEAKNR